MPKVSVIMSIYNSEKYLKKAIESILNQTYTDFEFIIINDGSVDDGEKIVKSYKDKRIVYINNEQNIGLAASLNKGIKLAKGEYIARMDADDISRPERLAKQVEFLDDNIKVGVVGANIKILTEDNKQIEFKYFTDDADLYYAFLYDTAMFAHPVVMIRKSVMFDNYILYDENFGPAQDFKLWNELKKVTKLANLNEVLLDYREHSQSVTTTKKSLQDSNAFDIRLKELKILLRRGPYSFELKILNREYEKVSKNQIESFLNNIPNGQLKTKILNLWAQKNERSANMLKRLFRAYKKYGLKILLQKIIIKIKRKIYTYQDKISGKTRPVACSLFMSEICNFKCAGCRRQIVGHDKKGFLELDDVKLLLKKYPTIMNFTIAGLGEPTMSPNFVEIIKYLNKKGKGISVITNGTKVEAFEELKGLDIQISISLYGLNKGMYQEYTGTSLFNDVIEFYKEIKKDFPRTGFSYICFRDNYKQLPDLLNLMDELKPKFVNLHNYLVYSSTDKEERAKTLTLDDVEIIKYIDDTIGNRNYVTKPQYMDLSKSGFYCDSYNSTINLSPDGGIGACRRQIPPSLEYGNLYEEKDPYNNKTMTELRVKIEEGEYPHDECKYCFGRLDNVGK